MEKLVLTYQICKCSLRVVSIGVIGVLYAADPTWTNKPIPQWNEEDARQILTSSPWVKNVIPVQLADLTAQQRREGGATGGGKGTGFSALDGGVFSPDKDGPKSNAPKLSAGRLALRWESAIPVRAAELKAGEVGAPDWEGDYLSRARSKHRTKNPACRIEKRVVPEARREEGYEAVARRDNAGDERLIDPEQVLLAWLRERRRR